MPKEQAGQKVAEWQDVLARGDEDAFHRLVDPYVDRLMQAARYDLEYYLAQGYLQKTDFTPEEIVGETQLYAWEHRNQCPDKMSLRGWLLGVQHRLLRQLVERERAYRDDKLISLDEQIPINYDNWASQESFWDWAQPEGGDKQVDLWEDIIPAQTPVDIEIDLDKVGRDALLQLDESARHVLVMHDEFEVDLPEVAVIMGRGVNEVAELIELARANLRERLGNQQTIAETDVPAPPEGSDE